MVSLRTLWQLISGISLNSTKSADPSKSADKPNNMKLEDTNLRKPSKNQQEFFKLIQDKPADQIEKFLNDHRGLDLNFWVNYQSKIVNPLIFAVIKNKFDSIDCLLSHGADPNMKADSNKLVTSPIISALHYAVALNNDEVLKRFILAGADLNPSQIMTLSHYIPSPLNIALHSLYLKGKQEPDPKMIQLLIIAGAKYGLYLDPHEALPNSYEQTRSYLKYWIKGNNSTEGLIKLLENYYTTSTILKKAGEVFQKVKHPKRHKANKAPVKAFVAKLRESAGRNSNRGLIKLVKEFQYSCAAKETGSLMRRLDFAIARLEYDEMTKDLVKTAGKGARR